MQTSSMIFAGFIQTIDIWIDSLDGYTLEMLCRLPLNGSWSLGQVYRHIIDDTTWFMEQMEIALLNDDNTEMEMTEDARRLFAANDFPDIQIKGPATYTIIPQPKSKEELKAGLMSIKHYATKLFSDYNPELAKGKTEHPGFKFFSAIEWLQFADMHMRHHLRQKERIDRELFLK
ncbi:MAG TPA: DinB family protein [Mucilaginibacter sp.]